MDINLTPNVIFNRNAAAQRIMQAHANVERILAMRNAPAARSSYCAHIDKLDAERVAKRNGHAAEGGLQKHSVGDTYPYMLVAYGDGTFAACNATTGWEMRCHTIDHALALCAKMKACS